MPLLCGEPTITSVSSGKWSDPEMRSPARVPGTKDRVAISKGHDVAYDEMSASKLDCVEVRGHLTFVPARETRMNVGTLMVPEGGYLEVGRPGEPIDAAVAAELVITDQRLIRARTRPSWVPASSRWAGSPCMVRSRRRPSSG